MSVKLHTALSTLTPPQSRSASGTGAPLRKTDEAAGPSSNARHAPIADEPSNGKTRVLGNTFFATAPGRLQPVDDLEDPRVAEHLDWICRTLAGVGDVPRVPVYRGDEFTASTVMAAFLDHADPLEALRRGIAAVDTKAEVRKLEKGEFGQEYGNLERVLYAAVKTGDRELHVAVTDAGMFPRLTEAGQEAALGPRVKKH